MVGQSALECETLHATSILASGYGQVPFSVQCSVSALWIWSKSMSLWNPLWRYGGSRCCVWITAGALEPTYFSGKETVWTFSGQPTQEESRRNSRRKPALSGGSNSMSRSSALRGAGCGCYGRKSGQEVIRMDALDTANSKGGSTYRLFVPLGFPGFQPTSQAVYTSFWGRGMNIRPFGFTCPGGM